jgi:hypothetical protein
MNENAATATIMIPIARNLPWRTPHPLRSASACRPAPATVR